MTSSAAQEPPIQSTLPCRPLWSPALLWRVRLLACLALLTALAACGSRPTYHARAHYNPSRYYPPPGPASDPWGPYIREASGRFGIPDQWIRSVMRQESGGQEDVISWAGAVGLMQVMPDTYENLRERYNLGDDPFDPHNNILAGTAYLREMYDRFGSPGFLAAYNAGPNRVDRYLNEGTPLPSETVNYVASIAPRLGAGTPMSGPLAVYGGSGQPTLIAARPMPAGCDPDAAYNPNGPCTPLRPPVQAPVVVAAPVPVAYAQAGACDPDAAYDPSRPCQPMPSAPVAVVPSPARAPYVASGDCDPDAAYDPAQPCRPLPRAPIAVAPPQAAPTRVMAEALPPVRRPTYPAPHRPVQETMAMPVAFAAAPPPGHWAIQVGAFANLRTAESAAENARSVAPDLLRTAKIELPATTPFGAQVAFRARLSGLTPSMAADACSRLNGRGMACITVPPSHDSF
jgi:D-alanyl-D-alanine carboxypeptidase